MDSTSRIEQLKQMLTRQPEDPFLHFALGQEYAGLEELSKSIACYEKVVEIDENYTGVYFHYVDVLHKSGQINRALKVGQTGMEICKSNQAEKDLVELRQLLENFE